MNCFGFMHLSGFLSLLLLGAADNRREEIVPCFQGFLALGYCYQWKEVEGLRRK